MKINYQVLKECEFNNTPLVTGHIAESYSKEFPDYLSRFEIRRQLAIKHDVRFLDILILESTRMPKDFR